MPIDTKIDGRPESIDGAEAVADVGAAVGGGVKDAGNAIF